MTKTMDAEAQRTLAAALFNGTWDLLELPVRTSDQDDEMLHMAHASRHHWGAIGRWPNMAAGEWQCSRVYAVLGRAEPAMWHARRCLELCEEHGIGDYGPAAAYEALARAALVSGDFVSARQWQTMGLEACEAISEPEDRAPIETDLRSLTIPHA
jgi:hypothetical protein